MLAVAVIIEWLILNMNECLLQMIDLFPKLEVFNEMHVSRMLVACKFSSSEQSQVRLDVKYQSLRMTMFLHWCPKFLTCDYLNICTLELGVLLCP